MFFSKHLHVLLELSQQPCQVDIIVFFITKKGTEAQRGEVTFLKPHSQKAVELEFATRQSRVCGSKYCPILPNPPSAPSGRCSMEWMSAWVGEREL